MYDKLLWLKSSGSFVSVYYDADEPSKFLFGTIDALDEEFVLLALYTVTGAPAGLKMIPVDVILRIEYGDRYAERMKKLIGNVAYVPTGVNEPVLESMLDYCKKCGRVAAIELNDSGDDDVLGIVESVTDTLVTVKQIDVYGEEDGRTVFLIDDVSGIELDSDQASSRTRLYRMSCGE